MNHLYPAHLAHRDLHSVRPSLGTLLRISSTVAMVSTRVPLEKIAQYLGHWNVAITYQTDARFAPDHLQDAAEILDFVQIRNAR
jgi:hypothetical protein